MIVSTCSKAHGIRGRLSEECNEDIAYGIGRAYAQYNNPKCKVVCGDIGPTVEPLKQALAKGLIDIGITGTEEVHVDADDGIEVAASKNPMDCNGMKPVRRGVQPIVGDTHNRTALDYAPISV